MSSVQVHNFIMKFLSFHVKQISLLPAPPPLPKDAFFFFTKNKFLPKIV
jgi:hypothetical protein